MSSTRSTRSSPARRVIRMAARPLISMTTPFLPRNSASREGERGVSGGDGPGQENRPDSFCGGQVSPVHVSIRFVVPRFFSQVLNGPRPRAFFSALSALLHLSRTMSLGTISWRINLPPRSSHFNPSSVHVRKRRRLKILANFETPDIVPAKWDSLLQGFSAAITSANWRNLFLPALGVGSGAAVFLSGNNRLRYENSSGAVAGEWFLIASPTPFNRSVFLRCPSVSLENKKSPPDIASENIFCRGQITASETDAASARDISYQRFCLRTDDGGVISLDWPEHLDLAGELGLDMTVLVVPGTPDGSSANEVRAFVREALGRGVFPVIVNPRGCAGSPLTTPRWVN